MIALWMASLVGHALDIHVGEPVRLPVDTADNLPPTVGFTANARIQPHGEPATWWIEYGPDETYGNATEPRALPGRLEAHFAEDWADGTRQWAAGMSGVQLAHHERGGPDGGPFLRYTDDQGAGNDTNHLDGIGMIHLGPYAYLGNYTWAYPMLPLYLGGGFPDFRGATISVALRGVDWEPHGTEIGTLIQAYRDPSVVDELPEDLRYPNWAFTGDPQTAHLVSGDWEDAEWVLRNRTADWTFAGANGGRLLYDYGELDTILRGVNVDFFLLQILYVDLLDQPTGSIDVADLEITFRQHSVCAASNGGRLVEDPRWWHGRRAAHGRLAERRRPRMAERAEPDGTADLRLRVRGSDHAHVVHDPQRSAQPFGGCRGRRVGGRRCELDDDPESEASGELARWSQLRVLPRMEVGPRRRGHRHLGAAASEPD